MQLWFSNLSCKQTYLHKEQSVVSSIWEKKSSCSCILEMGAQQYIFKFYCLKCTLHENSDGYSFVVSISKNIYMLSCNLESITLWIYYFINSIGLWFCSMDLLFWIIFFSYNLSVPLWICMLYKRMFWAAISLKIE